MYQLLHDVILVEHITQKKTVGLLNLSDIAISAGGLGFDPRSLKSDTLSPTASRRCDVSLGSVVQALRRGNEPAIGYTFRRDNASAMNIRFFLILPKIFRSS